MSAGYSGTPLLKKLGIKSGDSIWFVQSPPNYQDLLGPLPKEIKLVSGNGRPSPASCDFIHFFTASRQDLERWLPVLKEAIATNGMLWLSWPKKSSGVESDLNDNVVRELGLAQGLVDVKVAAIDSTWSGLKFVYRLVDR